MPNCLACWVAQQRTLSISSSLRTPGTAQAREASCALKVFRGVALALEAALCGMGIDVLRLSEAGTFYGCCVQVTCAGMRFQVRATMWCALPFCVGYEKAGS